MKHIWLILGFLTVSASFLTGCGSASRCGGVGERCCAQQICNADESVAPLPALTECQEVSSSGTSTSDDSDNRNQETRCCMLPEVIRDDEDILAAMQQRRVSCDPSRSGVAAGCCSSTNVCEAVSSSADTSSIGYCCVSDGNTCSSSSDCCNGNCNGGVCGGSTRDPGVDRPSCGSIGQPCCTEEQREDVSSVPASGDGCVLGAVCNVSGEVAGETQSPNTTEEEDEANAGVQQQLGGLCEACGDVDQPCCSATKPGETACRSGSCSGGFCRVSTAGGSGSNAGNQNPFLLDCESARDADTCVRRQACGWCEDGTNNRCLRGLWGGSDDRSCSRPQWRYHPRDLGSTEQCSNFTSCESCVLQADARCGWCKGSSKCVGGGLSGPDVPEAGCEVTTPESNQCRPEQDDWVVTSRECSL